jgi:ADP-heptose:LPS heptosyltransferase
VATRRALVTAASGIGDVLRVTPLIRVCVSLGYEVDVLIAADYPETSQLLVGAQEISRVISRPSRWRGFASSAAEGQPLEHYSVATFTYWSSPLRSSVRADRSVSFDTKKWLIEGDSACVSEVARSLGWSGKLPPPFAMKSGRKFGLKPGTAALHPGCKPDWPWKKWHGFAELARQMPEVVVIGTPADFDNSKTYFQRSFDWPEHVADYTGKLCLLDVAALLSECAALISNDSGMMHLGVALGVPTFGIFGITSPLRELMPESNIFPITKQLSCEYACHRGPWGRRDCEYHLLCLKTLAPKEVLEKVCAQVELGLYRVAAAAIR